MNKLLRHRVNFFFHSSGVGLLESKAKMNRSMSLFVITLGDEFQIILLI